jgi:hypothetical protein
LSDRLIASGTNPCACSEAARNAAIAKGTLIVDHTATGVHVPNDVAVGPETTATPIVAGISALNAAKSACRPTSAGPGAGVIEDGGAGGGAGALDGTVVDEVGGAAPGVGGAAQPATIRVTAPAHASRRTRHQ